MTATSSSQCQTDGHACAPCANSSFICNGGTCECGSADAECAGTCIDPQTNDTYCGASLASCAGYTTCSGGQTCQTGSCQCASGDAFCVFTGSTSGTCIDPQTNDTFCGASTAGCAGGQTCSGGETCQSGQCLCPSDEINCGTTSSPSCVADQTDPNNCGACAHSCGKGTCVAGMCQPVAICTYETADGGLPVGAAFDVTINSSGTLGFTWGVGGTTGAIIECTTSQENAKVSAFYTLSVAPFGIASDSSNFYWTNENAGTLQSAPTGTSSPVTTLESSLSNPVGVATFAPSGSIASTQVIYSTGQGVDDYNTTSNSSCFGGTSLPYFMGIGGPPTAPWLAVSDVTGNAVYATALSSCTGTSGIGRALVPIANNVPGPDTAVTDGTTAFFGTRGVGTSDGAVFSCPVGGCSPQNNPSPYVASQGTVGRLALDGNNLIWTSAIYGLRECSKLGCTTPTNLASSVYTIAMVAQGGTIYYVFGNTLYSLAE